LGKGLLCAAAAMEVTPVTGERNFSAGAELVYADGCVHVGVAQPAHVNGHATEEIMSDMRRTLLGAAGIVLAFGMMAAADTLQLKNGTVVQGKYLGGSERALQFEVGGQIQLYEISQVLSVTFTGTSAVSSGASSVSGAASAAAPSSAPTTAAAAQTGSATVPAGTRLVVRMIDGVDSQTNRVGDRFRASLESDLVVNNVVVAPRGADVYGRLAEAQQAGRLVGKAELKLELTDIMIRNRMQPVMTGEYELAGEGRGGSTARRAGGGAAVGAVIGALAGGGKGAAIGAGVGAGAGTAVNIATRGEQVRVPSETLLEFRLEQPFTPQLN
jgi:hypothetical protein